jgi:hypothetical protein
MKNFILQTKVLKNGEVKVRITNTNIYEDSYPLFLKKYPDFYTKKYYTISTISPIKKDNIIPSMYKENIKDMYDTFRNELRLANICIQEEKHSEMFMNTPELSSMKRESCLSDFFNFFKL